MRAALVHRLGDGSCRTDALLGFLGVPAHTSTHGFRIADELWRAAREVAAEQGETVTDVVVRSLEAYVRAHGYGVDPVTALERLARLHASGGLTDAEWAMKRRELLDRI